MQHPARDLVRLRLNDSAPRRSLESMRTRLSESRALRTLWRFRWGLLAATIFLSFAAAVAVHFYRAHMFANACFAVRDSDTHSPEAMETLRTLAWRTWRIAEGDDMIVVFYRKVTAETVTCRVRQSALVERGYSTSWLGGL